MGWAQPTVGGAIPGLVVLGPIRKQASKPWGQASKQHPSMASASAPASGSCPDFSVIDCDWEVDVSETNPSSHVAMVTGPSVSIAAAVTLTRVAPFY